MMNEFRARTQPCGDCYEGKYESRGRYGYIEHVCETCDGLGEIDCACAECNVIRPLNDDGLCRDCSSLIELEVEELPNGRFRVAA